MAISSKKKEKKSGKKPQASQWNLDPRMLKLDASHFVDPDGDEIEQIELGQVAADPRGIAICSGVEALPYIKEPKNLSTEPLALLITEDIPVEQRGLASICSIRFPATFIPTNDPLLINGSLLQLGDAEVSRNVPDNTGDDMDVVTTCVLKVQMFRDEVEIAWKDISDSPIRALIKAVPVLRLCPDVKCNLRCGAFHPSVEDDIDQVVHEVWARRFQSIEGKQCSSDKAEVFQAFLRVATPAMENILKMLVTGIYFEPRSDGLRTTSSDYAVIWLPGASRETALHKMKTTTLALSLVRLKNRYGDRVHASHEAAIHKELRPGDQFLKVDVCYVYRLHPLPHGLQRAQVTKILKEWGWAAKPLQPAKGSPEGGSWDVGASQAPPNSVQQAFGHDILITLVRDRSEPAKITPVIGPRRVQARLQKPRSSGASSSSNGDPWWNAGTHDPWGLYHPPAGVQTQPMAVSMTDGTSKRFDALAEQLKTDLTEGLKQHVDQQISTAAPSQQPDTQTQQRLQKLEVGMGELQAQGQRFAKFFEDTGAKIQAQDHQLGLLNQGLAQQQQDLQAVRSEVHTSAETLHQAMSTSFTTMKTELAQEVTSSIDAQLQKFEALITGKHQRTH